MATTAGRPTTELLRRVLGDTTDLVRAELALAKQELGTEGRATLMAALIGTAAGALSILAVTMLVLALVIALGARPSAALAIAGAALIVMAGIGAFGAWKLVPKRPLERTRSRIESDVERIEERAA